MGVEQLFRDAFHAARSYRAQWRAWEASRRGAATWRGAVPRRDLELDAIAEILEGKRWIHCHSYRQDEILAFLRVLDEFDVTVGSLQHCLEGYKVADELARHGATASCFSDWWAYKFEVYDAIPYAGTLMQQNDVVVSFNSDDRELGRRLALEAAKAVKYGGMEPEEALRLVTLNPAKQLRIDSLVGSLEPGKDADLVLWSGSPLSSFSRCEQTWIDGRKYFDRAEDLAARRRMKDLRDQLIQKILAAGEDGAGVEEAAQDPAKAWLHAHESCRDEVEGGAHRD